MSTLKILHLESADSDSIEVNALLKRCDFVYEYAHVKNFQEFVKEFSSFSPLVVIADYSLISANLEELFLLISSADRCTPLLLTADNYSKEIALLMAKSGADDFIFKDRPERLPLAITHALHKILSTAKSQATALSTIRHEKQFQTLFENISDAILLIDAKGTITYQSPSAEKTTGFTFSESNENSIFKFVHPSDIELVTRYLKQALQQPAVSIASSYRLQLKTGSFIWVEGTFTNSLNDSNISAIIINFRDVTQRKLSEERHQKSEANLRTIFDNTTVSYILSDASFNVLSFNSTAVTTYAKEFKVNLREGDNLLDYLPSERKIESRKRFEKALSGEKVNYELSFLQTEGSATWYDVNMFVVRDDSNTVLGLIISSENITQRKEIEFERNKMLSDIVRHNKDLEQFAYIISHNLRSPVANILGLSALIENSPDMDEKTFNDCMKGLSMSVKKLDEVIIDLNYILQTRTGINEKKELVNFPELINDIKTSIRNQIENQSITITTRFTSENFFTLKSYLHSVFFNLISNSIKYRNPAVPLTIEIQSKKINNTLVLEFRDNGLGIDLSAHGNTIFGLYKKFHNHIEGKGVGLYMVKTQVEMLGGKISIASEPNVGTTFTIEFEEPDSV